MARAPPVPRALAREIAANWRLARRPRRAARRIASSSSDGRGSDARRHAGHPRSGRPATPPPPPPARGARCRSGAADGAADAALPTALPLPPRAAAAAAAALPPDARARRRSGGAPGVDGPFRVAAEATLRASHAELPAAPSSPSSERLRRRTAMPGYRAPRPPSAPPTRSVPNAIPWAADPAEGAALTARLDAEVAVLHAQARLTPARERRRGVVVVVAPPPPPRAATARWRVAAAQRREPRAPARGACAPRGRPHASRLGGARGSDGPIDGPSWSVQRTPVFTPCGAVSGAAWLPHYHGVPGNGHHSPTTSRDRASRLERPRSELHRIFTRDEFYNNFAFDVSAARAYVRCS